VDEAGMLDQDTAGALLTLADECAVRVALLGDRHQLPAVGRGGVLDLAIAQVDPAAVLTLDTVHRFVRSDAAGRLVTDAEYAELTLAMRAGADPGAVFDALAARGQIQLHPDPTARHEALAALAAAALIQGQPVAAVVDTGEQAAELNAAIRDRLIAAGRVDDTRTATTRAGARIGAGDRIATRRNDRTLGVANRDSWTVTAVGPDGALLVTPAGAVSGKVTLGVTPTGPAGRVLPAGYVTSYVEPAYACTAYGVQGHTVPAAHVVIGEHTGAACAYVGMTRGGTANTAHLIAADLAQARAQWIAVFARDRSDLGPGHAAGLAAAEAAQYSPARSVEQALADLHAAWTVEQRCLDRLHLAESRRDLLHDIVSGLEERETHQTHRLAELTAACHRAAAKAEDAARLADVSATVVAAEADRLAGEMSAAWHDQRDTAHRAAHVVLEGPGRLGLRRAAVTRAGEQLAAWADTWRACLPDMPNDPRQVAALAVAADDQVPLRVAFDRRANQSAEAAHPEHARLAAAADATEAAHDRARRDLADAHRQHENRLPHADESAQPQCPAGQLADTDREIAAIRVELSAARHRLEQLLVDPSLLSQPSDRLASERDRWRARYDLEQGASRRTTHSAAQRLGDDRLSAATSAGLAAPRTAPSLGISR
jgi:exodeoxyribonuclease V alpha subunit